ncbi:MAG: glycerophosphodiester phosphodiesterase [Acidimicrobiales bacterium]
MDPARTRLPAPLGFAHRGARAELPDNTLPAFELALKLGATGLESDVWLTADRVAVLDHDGVIRRRGRGRRISELRASELSSRIPTLAALYQRCGSDYHLSLDVKDPAAFEQTLDDAAAAGASGRLWLCDSSGSRLGAWRSAQRAVHLVQSTRRRHVSEGIAERARRLAGAGIDALNLPGGEWTRADVESVHEAGLLAFGWDAQDASTLQKLLRDGLDAVYSDHVAMMMSAIAELLG